MAKQNKKRNNGINKNNYEYGNNNDWQDFCMDPFINNILHSL